MNVSSIDDVVKLILNTVDVKSTSVGVMGHALLEMAKKHNEVVTDEEALLISQMKQLKIAEQNQNLLWVDYGSWNSFGVTCREYFTETLKPLFWNGVFTTFTDFVKVEKEFAYRLNPDCPANIVRIGSVYQIFCANLSIKHYSFMNTKEFEELSSKIKKSLIRGYSRNGNKIFIKEYKQQEGDVYGGTSNNGKSNSTEPFM